MAEERIKLDIESVNFQQLRDRLSGVKRLAPVIERVTEAVNTGEAPHWDVKNQVLYFVDVHGKALNKYDPATEKHTKGNVDGDQVSFVIPVKDNENHFVIGLGTSVAIAFWDGESDQVKTLKILDKVESPKLLNDAKVDETGRLWTGDQVVDLDDIEGTKPMGCLYNMDITTGHQLKTQLTEVKIANGMAWNVEAKNMFYIDSLKYGVDRYSYDAVTGTITKGEEWFSLKEHDIPGIPDGMTIDTDGNLWVGVYGGGMVLKIDGSKPNTLLDFIEMPAIQTTSVAFGGKNLDVLYVTTAALSKMGYRPAPPINGATYKVTNIGAKGYAPNDFIFENMKN